MKENKPLPYVMKDGFISIMVDFKPKIVERSHPNYTLIVDKIKNNDWTDIPSLIDIQGAVQTYVKSDNDIEVKGGVIYYKGEEMHNVISGKILDMMSEGFDIKPMTNFLSNLMKNPSKTAVDELYSFLEHGHLPITEDGCFLAYKKIREDYTDIHSGKFDNSVGAVAEMPRNEVDDDRSRTCSTGLHFCSYEYLSNFGYGSNNRVVVLSINPADVVSIPADYNDTKGRCCKYTVVGEIEGWVSEGDTLANTSVNTNYPYSDIEEDDWDDLEAFEDDEYIKEDIVRLYKFGSRSDMREFVRNNGDDYVGVDMITCRQSIFDNITQLDPDAGRWVAAHVDYI